MATTDVTRQPPSVPWEQSCPGVGAIPQVDFQVWTQFISPTPEAEIFAFVPILEVSTQTGEVRRMRSSLWLLIPLGDPALRPQAIKIVCSCGMLFPSYTSAQASLLGSPTAKAAFPVPARPSRKQLEL